MKAHFHSRKTARRWMAVLLISCLMLTVAGCSPWEEAESSESVSGTTETSAAPAESEDSQEPESAEAESEEAESGEAESAETEAPETADTETSETETEETEGEGAEAETETTETESAEEQSLPEQRLAEMTLEEKVGQMILARYPGHEEVLETAASYSFGGYVLFDKDFREYSEEEVTGYLDRLQEMSDIPLLLAVDEEGGTVTRVSDYYREDGIFRAPRYVYEDGGWEAIEAETEEKCELLMRLHLNMNLAPVADIAGDTEDFMYDRSFSGDPELAAEFVSRTVTVMNRYHIACSLKHFPGYGDNEDTHTGIALDDRELETFETEDFLPFLAGIEAGAGTILVSHNIVSCFDSELPASLSPAVHEAARDLGFEGVLITDDLAMGAITEYCGETDAAVLAVLAGNDMLITSEYETQYLAILEAVEAGTISEERIDESVLRILKLKEDMGLLE